MNPILLKRHQMLMSKKEKHYPVPEYSFSGSSTIRLMSMSGTKYWLITMTSSGTLSFPGRTTGDLWMIGGGNGGKNGTTSSSGYGSATGGCGGGGGFVFSQNNILVTSASVTVGAGGEANAVGSPSVFGSYQTETATTCKNGGTGGGGSGTLYQTSTERGTGAGVGTIPFEDAVHFSPHGGGGGGGSVLWYNYNSNPPYRVYDGGAGGTNGGNGAYPSFRSGTSGITPNLSTGGDKGGGKGGRYGGYYGGNVAGTAGSYYGAGGGGGGAGTYSRGTSTPGAGYQGVVYFRIAAIPEEQEG